jgi:subtilisin family serine protease
VRRRRPHGRRMAAVFIGATLLLLAAFAGVRGLVASGEAAQGGRDAAPAADSPGIGAAGAAAGERGWVVLRRVNGRLVVDTYRGAELDVGVAELYGAAGASELLAVERDVPVELYEEPLRSRQWHLDTLPFESLHPAGKGSGVVVAVIDTAIALGHEDLGSLLPGWDAIADRALDPASWQTADADHGTHVAGLLAAVPDNGLGGSGVAPGVDILPVRVLGPGGGYVSDVIEGILWAIEHDADVVNLSLGTSVDSIALRQAVAEAEARGVVMVAASGNNGQSGSPVRYPAAIDTVLSVGAVQHDLTWWPQSSTAPYLDLVAPGVDLWSLGGASTDAYRTLSGTSMATPQVSGLVALMLEARPDLSPAQVRAILRAEARDLGPVGHDEKYGYGLLAPAAVMDALTEPPPPVPPPSPGLLDASYDAGQVILTWAPLSSEVEAVEIQRDGVVIARPGPATTRFVDPSPVRGRVHVYTVEVTGAGGTAWTSVSIRVPRVELRYWIVTDRGRVLPFVDAPTIGGADLGVAGAPPTVGGTPTSTGDGYWLVGEDGRVVAAGDARHHGDVGHLRLNAPIVGMAVTPSGEGYWLLGADGGVFAFGDAGFHGSTGGMTLNQPVVDMAVSPSGEGYWLVGADGGVFAFGDAVFHGSTGGIVLNEPVVSITAGETGYWLVGRDGGVFTFGVPYHGSIPGLWLDQAAVAEGMRIRTVDGGAGYLVMTADGSLYGFGSAAFLAAGAPGLEPGEQAVDLLLVQV